MRVVVLGPGAAGKSTFARRLGDATGVDAIELDQVFWSDDLTPLPRDEWIAVQTQLIATDSWILDGDLGPHDVLPTRLEPADTVVMFDPPLIRCVWRAVRRSRQPREFWVWLLTWRRREKPQLLAAIDEHAPTARVHMVLSDADAERLLTRLA